MDWLLGDKEAEVKYSQSPEQKQVWQALLPMLQKLGGATGNMRPNQFLTNWNKGTNPWTQQRMNQRPTNLPTQSMSYPTKQTMSPEMIAKILAAANKKRILNNQNPITMKQGL
jgi:hypothetical protein